MNTRYIISIALLSFCSAALCQQHVARKEDIVSFVYEFTLAADGKAHDIKVSQAFWQKDHSDAVRDSDRRREGTRRDPDCFASVSPLARSGGQEAL
jgi:hypothetical protein